MGQDVTNPVFGDSDRMRFKPACYAKETSLKFACSKSRYDTFQKAKKKKHLALIRLHMLVYAFVVRKSPKMNFLTLRPI